MLFKVIHHHFEVLDSTNTWAKQQAEYLDRQALTLITANMQTGGRGRFKRHWVSPPEHNIYATFCFFVSIAREDIGNVPQVLAVATAEVLEKYGFQPQLKWPNDVLLQGKKVAGILCETVGVEDMRCVVCGIGLNVNMPQEILTQIDRPATSLLVESGYSYSVQEILQALTASFHMHLLSFLDLGFAPFYPLFHKRLCFTTGEAVRFHDNQRIVEGHFECFNADGSILLRLPDGTIKEFLSGEFI